MCGRFTYLYNWKQLHRLMELARWPEAELSPRYNVAPTQMAPVVRQEADGARVGVMMQWGLVPSWATDPSIGSRLINARGETIAEKPAFRTAFSRRRCLAPVSGFYEWKVGKREARKQPYWIGRVDREPFALAGVWEHWEREGQVIESFTIITTTPNGLMSSLHDRMPVIIAAGDYGRWLDTANQDTGGLMGLIGPASEEGFEAYPVSTRVNSPRNEEPLLIKRVDPGAGSLF